MNQLIHETRANELGEEFFQLSTAKMDSEHIVSRSSRNQWAAAIGVTSIMFHTSIFEVYPFGNELGPLVSNIVAHIGLVTVGALLGAILADAFGRKRTLLIAIIFVVPRMLAIIFYNEAWIWIVRIFVQLGWGMTSTLVPLYISEIAGTRKSAGRMMTLQIPIRHFGLFVSATAVAIFSNFRQEQTWQLLNGIFLGISTLLHFIIVVHLPETPSYLISKKKYEEAADSLAVFEEISDIRIPSEVTILPNMNVQANENRQGCLKKISEIFQFENRRNLAIILSLVVITLATGLHRNTTMISDWFAMVFEFQRTPILIGTYGVLLVLSFIVTAMVDVYDRKMYLLIVIFGSFAAAIIGLTPLVQIQWIHLGVFVIQVFDCLMLYSMTLAYMGDVLSTNIRAHAIAIAVSCTVLINDILLIPEQYNGGQESATRNSTINTIVHFCSFAFVFVFFPNTNAIQRSQMTVPKSRGFDNLS